jgi:hypothetical protein
VATDHVVQVAEPNAAHGLVLGAASASAFTTNHDKDGNDGDHHCDSNNSNNENENDKLSFRYQVQQMTPLAITLEWGGGVRNIRRALLSSCIWQM